MKRVSIVSFLLCILLFPAIAPGLERFPVVSTMELEALLAERESGQTDFVLVNALDRIIADDAMIPGSINIPVHTLKSSDLLPEDRSKFIVFY